MTKPPVVVTHAYRPKRPRKPRQDSPPVPAAIVSARKPGKVQRQPAPDNGPVSDEVKAFFKRMVRPRGE